MLKAFTLSENSLKMEESDSGSESESELDITEEETGKECHFSLLPEYNPCVAHTPYSCGERWHEISWPFTPSYWQGSFCSYICKKSTYATDLLRNKRLQYANATGWNSELLMISSILRILKEKLNQLECSKLTTYDHSLLQDLWCPPESESYSQNHKLLVKALAKEKKSKVPVIPIDECASSPRKKCKVLCFMNQQMHPVAVTRDTELDEYLYSPCIAEDCNPLEYWKLHQDKYPSFAKLAQKYFNVPATSESVE